MFIQEATFIDFCEIIQGYAYLRGYFIRNLRVYTIVIAVLGLKWPGEKMFDLFLR